MSVSPYERERQRLSGLPRAERFESLLEFPCQHLFKVIGAPTGLTDRIRGVMAHQGHPDGVLVERPSKGGKWLSVSVELTVTSGAELDRLYTALEGLEGVRFLL